MDNNFQELDIMLEEWYYEGYATWSYAGANDGFDGLFGGSFHSIGSLHSSKDKNYDYEFEIDFGSSDQEKAIQFLNNMLKKINYVSEIIGYRKVGIRKI